MLHFVIIQRTLSTPHDYETQHALNLNFLQGHLDADFYEFSEFDGYIKKANIFVVLNYE